MKNLIAAVMYGDCGGGHSNYGISEYRYYEGELREYRFSE
jgi:hypothetical protein